MPNYLRVCLMTICIFAATCVPGWTQTSKPNIIFILTDDQRWDALGYSGNDIIQTPEMDALAREGCYFKNAFVTTPICSASRASIFSGVHERTHKYTFQTGSLRHEYMAESYPVLLRDAGYFTGFYGKFGVNYPDKEQLFDVFEDYDRNNKYRDYRGYYYKTLGKDTVHLTRYTGQKALDFIDSAPADRPFCLSISFSAPHAHDGAPLQYFWQDRPDRLYRDRVMPGPDLADDSYFEELPKPVRDGFNRLRWTWRYDTPEKYQHSVKGYYRMIYGIDLEISKIRERLRDTGQDRNTVIVLMGDNGYFLGERQLAGKWLMHENSIRVPLIVYDPRQDTHRDISEMALNIDVPSTLVDLAGVKQPASWHGESLMPLVTGRNRILQRDTILIEHLWEFEKIPPSEGVRTTEWKYFRYINDKYSEELYHLTSDPMETENLAGHPDYQDILEELRTKNDELGQRFADPYSGVPSGLTVELIRDPRFTPIQDPKPEFSWIVPGEAVIQKAYQLLVSSSRELAEMNIGDVWNSGQVRSNRSSGIELKGEDLKPNTRYFWKVRIFDRDNRLSEYSKIQTFITGSFAQTSITGNYFRLEKIAPWDLVQNPDGSYLADFGKDAFATLELNYQTKKKRILSIRLGEKLKDGRIDRNPGGTIRYQEVQFEVTPENHRYMIELVPDQRNTLPEAIALPDSFPVLMPFRYVEISGATDLTEENLTQHAYFNYFEESTSFFYSSDEILNQVWDLCKYSMKATTFAGYYVDGDRERIPYEADAYLNQLSHYSVDNEYAMARKTIEYFMQYPTWPAEWQLHVALMFFQDYMYTGNSELIERYYEPLKHKTLMALANEQGLISTASPNHNGELMKDLGFADTTERLRVIVDWPQRGGFGGVMGETDDFVFMPVNTVVNSFYYRNLVIMEIFAGLLGKTGEAGEFQYRAAQVKNSMNRLLFSKEQGYYVDGMGTGHGSLHANMLPLAFDMVPEGYKKSVADFIKTRGMACSVYGAQYLLEALFKAGEAGYALELMTATHDRSWYNMIQAGSTITMEAWDMKYKPNLDWNHAWGAVPGNIIPRHLWGIRPKTPGFGIVEIQPQPAGLTDSEIVYPTLKGPISCKFKKVHNRLTRYWIGLPANMVGELNLGELTDVFVTNNGNPVMMKFDNIRLEPGMNRIEVRMNSF